MPYFHRAFTTHDYRDNIEAVRAVSNFMASQKITAGIKYFSLFVSRDGAFDFGIGFIGAGFDFHEHDSPIIVYHDKVKLAGFARIVTRKEL